MPVLIATVRINSSEIANIYRDEYSYFSVYATVTADSTSPIITPVPGQQIGSSFCSGFTFVKYLYSNLEPYATPEVETNSPTCGFVDNPCDISFVGEPVVIAETEAGANDGKISVFAASGYTTTITYYLKQDGVTVAENTTGKFTDVEPGDYFVTADDGYCQTSVNVNVPAFDPNFTRFKYRMRFKSPSGFFDYDLRFYDQINVWPIAEYPKDLTGSEQPVIKLIENGSEDKTDPINATSLTINAVSNGIFTVDEFARSTERSWKIELYKSEIIDFQGWLLPDQVTDFYTQGDYVIQLIATDGLGSLKGVDFSDLSLFTDDVNGNPVYRKLYGVQSFSYLMKIMFEHLGYDYGETRIISSLQYNLTYVSNFWKLIALWGDNFYDSNDQPVSVYDALVDVLKALKLSIVQENGHFTLFNINDLYYIDKGSKAAQYVQAFYKFNYTFNILSQSFVYPVLQQIGYNSPHVPEGDNTEIRYDNAFGTIEANVDFDLLALLYPDPSFEIGQTIGELPFGWSEVGSLNAYITDETSYSGLNSLKISDTRISPTDILTPPATNYIYYTDGFVIDQPNKKLNISFSWKPVYFNNEGTPNVYYNIYLDGDNGKYYTYINPKFLTPGTNPWDEMPSSMYEPTGNVTELITDDYQAWNQEGITTEILPTTGTIYLTFRHLAFQSKDPDYDFPGGILTAYIDDLSITTSDANDPYTLQIGEIHRVVNFTDFSKAQVKTVDLGFFTYPPNKRVAGNVFYGNDYSGEVGNKWSFATQTSPVNDRLPATIIKAHGRNYQRPMYIYEGQVASETLVFMSPYTVEGKTGVIFFPFSIESDLRNGTNKVVLVEIEDSTAQFNYNYVPKYEKNARKNTS